MSRGAIPAPAGRAAAVAGCIVLAALPGCVGLGGNVKSSFACRAPDGICAPSAVIDDRALAMMSGDPSFSAEPVASAPTVAKSASRQAVRGPVAADAGRTRDRVMRIVFPAYIDEQGRLHEASAIHAVVAPGEWQAVAAEASPARNALAAAPQMQERANAARTGNPSELEVDPHLPHPDAVAAARRRGADPIAQIKADVQRRLASPPRRGEGQAPSASDARTTALTSSGGKQGTGPLHRAGVPIVREKLVPGSRPTSRSADAPPVPSSIHTVRAGSFPASVPEDQ
ncbi:TraV family lipoprotein (plasmid) [Sphingobium sp. JS3065]|uniref:TraV family lipoprotein n=1 Tax=Sphingobium sp. JS3065 TaxID=2970925 RepID=UPI0022650D81|nr:TraV family lipoprotein [Sphingobium sp. JS3065]UZW58087.1 TraV family lipoprotein [Sphingobium sp. JS3065]